MGAHRDLRERLLRATTEAADDSDGVLSRGQLRALGVGRDRVAAHVRAGRWRMHGRHTVALHTGELMPLARAWRGVHESVGDARVDGVTSLQVAGVTGLSDTTELDHPGWRGHPADEPHRSSAPPRDFLEQVVRAHADLTKRRGV